MFLAARNTYIVFLIMGQNFQAGFLTTPVVICVLTLLAYAQ